jgi:DNA invertase Pin-like site-specific DNA recombinase
MYQPSVPFVPKHPDGKLRAIVIGRISTEHQKEESIDASFRYVREHLARIYDGPAEIEYLGERASGMLTDRATIRQAEELITRGRIDLVIAEDLSRIYRNPRLQYDFVQNAVDHGCRVICIADNLDTATDHWEVMLGAAAFRHGTYLPDVRRRVRRTATHAFHNGGMVLRCRYGYRRLSKEEAASGHFGPKGLRIAKVPECTETIRQMCGWVHDGISYMRIAERMNEAEIPPGPYCKQLRWTSAAVVNLLRDPILSGTRRFRVVVHEPIFATGKHRRRKGEQPETEVYAELAHLTVTEQSALWGAMDQRGELWRDPDGSSAKRLGVPRSKALWPGQSATCNICGGRMYDLGTFLKCQNALPGAAKPCWNHVQVPVELTRQKLLSWVTAEADKIPGGRDALVSLAWNELERSHRGSHSESRRLDYRIAELKSGAGHLAKAIAKGGELDVLVQELKAIETQIAELEVRKTELVGEELQVESRLTREQVDSQLNDHLLSLLGTSYELGDVLRRTITEFAIFPVQALDTPAVRPRARLTLDLERLGETVPRGKQAAVASTVLDLFEPPEHIRWIDFCMTLKDENPKLSLKQIAARLGIGHMTVKRALGYARLMKAMGVADPYRELPERPATASRWHPKRSRG